MDGSEFGILIPQWGVNFTVIPLGCQWITGERSGMEGGRTSDGAQEEENGDDGG